MWIVALGASVWLVCRPQTPGIAIGTLGAVAAIMAILPLTSRGRFLWTIVVFLLLISEFRAIREQNAQFLSDKKALNSQFKSIRDTENSDFKITVDKLQTAIHTSEQQFQHTMFRVKQTLTAAQEATKSANAARLNTLPRAMIELHAITSDRRVSAPDLYQGLVPQDFEKQETMHVSFFNRGTAEADEFRYAGKLYLARPGNLADEITVSSEFDRAWKHSAISSDGPIRPSTQPYPAPFKSERILRTRNGRSSARKIGYLLLLQVCV